MPMWHQPDKNKKQPQTKKQLHPQKTKTTNKKTNHHQQ